MASRAAAAPLPLLLCACRASQHYQSMFGDGGAESRQFETLFWIFLAICAAMYVLVVGFLLRPQATVRRTA